MDVSPKFIIETDDELGDCLIIGKCTYHKDIANDIKKVKSAGWWRRNEESNTFIFKGGSHDFNDASREDIQKCVDLGNVFTDKYLSNCIANEYSFQYDFGYELVDIKNLKIKND